MSWRDLQWRRRRFAIAVVSASLVFSLTLILDGLTAHIGTEVTRVVGSFDADAWVVAPGTAGPFTATKLLPAAVADEVRELPGITRAEPMIAARETVRGTWINVLGYSLDTTDPPGAASSGRLPTGPGEALVDELLGFEVGETITLGGSDFRVVGTADDISYNFGAPTVMMSIAETQRVFLGGQDLIGAVAIDGTPDGLSIGLPDGLQEMTNEQVEADMHVGMDQSLQIVDILNGLLWIIAAAIIASIVYLSALERVRDFAVMKAIGVSNRSLMIGLACSSLLLSILAGLGATLLAFLLGPTFPLPIETPPASYVTLLVVSLAVGLLASLAGLRQAVGVDPARAFGGG